MTEDYKRWVRAEAVKIKSDGCTASLEIKRECCYEHDLGYYYGRDPRDAFDLFKKGHSQAWENAKKIGKVKLDIRLGNCSKLYHRTLGTLIGGWGIWRRKRQERP
jgi:hypothetical protein